MKAYAGNQNSEQGAIANPMNGTFSFRARRLHIVVSVLLLSVQNANALELQAILDSTAIEAPARVEFREERHNKMLKDALLLTGYLEYLDGGVFRKVVETPFEESFLIEQNRIRIERDGEVRTLPLNKSRPLKAMLAGIAAILAGRAEVLESMFHCEISGTAGDWSLSLVPRSHRLAQQLTGLIFTGDNAGLAGIRIEFGNGEWQVITIGQPDPQT